MATKTTDSKQTRPAESDGTKGQNVPAPPPRPRPEVEIAKKSK